MKSLNLSLLSVSVLLAMNLPAALAVKTAIEASGNVSMNGALRAYQDNVLQSVTKECLAQKAAKETIVSLTVDPHGNIMRVVITNSGLSSDGVKQTIAALQALKLGDAGENQSDTLRITFNFDLAEVLAGAKSTGTSISIHGGSITGDGTATGGIRIGGGSITSNGGSISIGDAQPASIGETRQRIGAVVPVRPAVTPEALSKLADLEKSPDGNPQELCNARLAVVQQYQRAGNFTKAKAILQQALKYLEGPAGPLSRSTARDLQRIGQSILANQTAGDDDLLWRVYALIERKAPGGCTTSDLSRLMRIPTTSGQNINNNNNNGDNIASILSRLVEVREMREGTDSPKLVPILTDLVLVSESQHRYDSALTSQLKIIRIQQKAGNSGDADAASLLSAARLCVLNGKYAEAAPLKNKVLAIAALAQTSEAAKSSIDDGLGTLASAYIEKGAPPDEPISLLEFLLEKPKSGTPALKVNMWRYQLAQLYLDQSNAVAKKSPKGSKNVKDLQNKSKVYFDTAQNFAKNDPTASDQLTQKFVKERIDALRQYGMTKEADDLQAQQTNNH